MFRKCTGTGVSTENILIGRLSKKFVFHIVSFTKLHKADVRSVSILYSRLILYFMSPAGAFVRNKQINLSSQYCFSCFWCRCVFDIKTSISLSNSSWCLCVLQVDCFLVCKRQNEKTIMVTTWHPSLKHLSKILQEKYHQHIQKDIYLKNVSPKTPIIVFRKMESIRNYIVRTDIKETDNQKKPKTTTQCYSYSTNQ